MLSCGRLIFLWMILCRRLYGTLLSRTISGNPPIFSSRQKWS
jgi:hypothetical protein